MTFRFLSVCSGIEAASVAWAPLGWKAWAFSEIEPFPCSLLAHHYPDVPNLCDMTKFQDWPLPDEPIDLLCGGTPCQSFSVAGLRKGLADPRGNLMLTYLAIAHKYRPRWLVWENVPGVLSSNGGRDFGAFLGGLGQLGYGFAYRVFDAQYFGVAQRRRRVFVVGHLGDWRRAAAVLFERHSLQGHPAPRRETRQGVAGTLSARTQGGGGLGADFELGGGLIPERERALTTSNQRIDAETETLLVTHALRGEGFDASEDGTGRGTPLVPVAFDTTQITSQTNRSNPQPGDPCHPLAAGAHAPAIAFPANLSGTQCASAEDVSPALGALNPTAVAFSSKDYGGDATLDLAPTLRAMNHAGSHANVGGQMAVAVALRGREGGATAELGDEVQNCLRASSGGGDKPHILTAMQVRRLTPTECERLQGFPDDYTHVPIKSYTYRIVSTPAQRRFGLYRMRYVESVKFAADGPRYKAIGNSWAVPCAHWIGERIAAVDSIPINTESKAA